ncbi:hypothetical protein ASD50_06030 [Mesorhizobium sp. Root552]|nr:hypothetical protein ASD50_06030 [Mesorhizobium sp. Root552]
MIRASQRKTMQPAKFSLSGAALLALATAAPAEPAKPFATATIERHWTSNALDSDRPIPDWFTLLRGSLERQWGDADANAGIGTAFEATRHDRVAIEDDRALSLSAHAFRRLSASLELRGSLGYRALSTGDDLDLGAIVIGTRALKQQLSVEAQLGIALDHGTALILEASESFETTGPTRFENDVLPATRLDPDTNRLHVQARLTRTVGPAAFGGSASALVASVEPLGVPLVALSFTLAALSAELAVQKANGASLGLAFGLEWLRGTQSVYSQIKPAWQIRATQPLPHGFELRGAWFGRYETVDSDDPLASWLDRAELELGWKISDRFALASGVFCELKQNLLFENEERSRGIYAEAAYALNKPLKAVMRVDLSRTFKTVIDLEENTIDAFFGLSADI